MDATTQHNTALNPDLIKRIAKGDVQAFGQLYDASSTRLFTLAHRILGQRDEAMDTVQEVYLEVWQKAARYDISRGTPIAWLFTLTRHRAVERLRSRGQRPALRTMSADKLVGQIVETHAVSPDAPTDAELCQMVSQALSALSSEGHQTLESAYYEGLTVAEIASRANEPVGTIKVRIKQSMERLRDLLRTNWEPHKRYGT